MLRFIQNLLGTESKPAKRKGRTSKHSQRRVLGMEGLERRELMAGMVGVTMIQAEPVAPKAVTVSVENHDLVIRGTDGPDKVQVLAPVNGKYAVKITTEVNGKAQTQTSYWRFTGGDVFFYGNKGAQRITTSRCGSRHTAASGAIICSAATATTT